MLTVEQIFDIREMYFKEGKSMREVYRISGYDRKTVKRYAEQEDFSIANRCQAPKFLSYSALMEIYLPRFYQLHSINHGFYCLNKKRVKLTCLGSYRLHLPLAS